MTFNAQWRLAALTAPAVLALAACGSSTPTSGSAASTPTATATAATTASPSAAGLPAALTAADIASAGAFTQKSDSALGGLANSDARVFANADGTMIVEIDLVTDTGATAAASDYPPYQSAAAKQVGTQSGTSSPGIGQQSDEYVGTNAAGKNAVSISFIEGRYIAVVTTLANTGVTPDVVKTTGEAIAQAQDGKINSIGS